MVFYFDDFALGTINYRPQWVELTKGKHVYRARDNEGVKIFTRQGWTPAKVGYVRLYAGQVDTGAEHTMAWGEYLRAIGR